MAPICRITMIKLKEEHLDIALRGFEEFTKAQSKDGSPYILSMEAGQAHGHVRDMGYTFVAKSTFKNREDMTYYEKECPAHEEFKAFLRANAPVDGLMMVAFEPGVSYAQ